MKSTKGRIICATVLGLLTLTAMTGNAADSSSSATVLDAPPPSQLHPYTVGVEIGTTGPGVAANWRFKDHFGAGVGFDYFSYSMNNRKIKDDTYNAKLTLMSEPLTLDWYPWVTSSFHVSVGGVFNQNHVTGNGTGALTVGGTTYVGTVNLDIKPQPVDPYLGIGWNYYFGKAHHWSLAGTLGVLYAGDAKVSLTSAPVDPTGTVAKEQAVVQKYANDLKFYPVLKLGLNYSF
jgi:hypothetical protein